METLYVDADNTSYKVLNILSELINFDNLSIKKIYGDWSRSELKNWSKKLHQYGLEPIHCPYNGKKQSTDIKLTIDMMDDINRYNIEKIYLITSDSDFTHLCQYISKNNIHLTILTINDTILKNYADEYINIKDNLIDYNIIEIINDIMGCKNIMSYNTFKKHFNNYETKLSIEQIMNYIKNENENFLFYKKSKSSQYIVYIYDLYNDYDSETLLLENICESHKDILSIIPFDNLIKLIF